MRLSWDKVYSAVTESTPPPRLLSSFPTNTLAAQHEQLCELLQTPQMDDVPKEELGTMYIDIPGFYAAFFGDVADLETRPRLFSRNAEKAVIHSIVRRVGGTDGPKTQSRKTS